MIYDDYFGVCLEMLNESHEFLFSKVVVGLIVLPNIHSLEEIFGIVRLPRLGHVLLNR